MTTLSSSTSPLQGTEVCRSYQALSGDNLAFVAMQQLVECACLTHGSATENEPASWTDWCLWGTHWQLGRGSDSVSSRPLRSQGQLRGTPSSLPGDSPALFLAPTFFFPPQVCRLYHQQQFTFHFPANLAAGKRLLASAERARCCSQGSGHSPAAWLPRGGNLFDDFVALSRSNISIFTWGHRDLCYPGAGSPSKAVFLFCWLFSGAQGTSLWSFLQAAVLECHSRSDGGKKKS